MHLLALRNPRGLNIQDRNRRPFLDPEHGSDIDDNVSAYAPPDENNSDNNNERDDNESDGDDNIKLHPPPDQEMAQGPAGVTIHNNAGVHQNENAGVHQTTNNAGVHKNANTHSP